MTTTPASASSSSARATAPSRASASPPTKNATTTSTVPGVRTRSTARRRSAPRISSSAATTSASRASGSAMGTTTAGITRVKNLWHVPRVRGPLRLYGSMLWTNKYGQILSKCFEVNCCIDRHCKAPVHCFKWLPLCREFHLFWVRTLKSRILLTSGP